MVKIKRENEREIECFYSKWKNIFSIQKSHRTSNIIRASFEKKMYSPEREREIEREAENVEI